MRRELTPKFEVLQKWDSFNFVVHGVSGVLAYIRISINVPCLPYDVGSLIRSKYINVFRNV